MTQSSPNNQAHLNKARQQLIEAFMGCLKEDTLPWTKGWHTTGERMRNAVSETEYHGCNAFLLMLVAYMKGYEDPRWCTFKQAQDQGWKIQKGSKGVPVEYWSVYDKKEKQTISLADYTRAVSENGRDKNDFSIVSRTYTVFNGQQIEGIPALEKKPVPKLTDIEMDGFVNNIKNNMDVGYREVGDQAYYSPSTDTVTMPHKEQFKSQHDFNSTLLHELSHATGHESRLNRDIAHSFGSPEYAKEELRAEISSAFMSQYIEVDISQWHLDNHKAYIQGWSSVLKEDPNVLFTAIKDAEKIADYLIEKGELTLNRDEQAKPEKKPSLDERISQAKKMQEEQSAGRREEKVLQENMRG